jgi:hypothetical protein
VRALVPLSLAALAGLSGCTGAPSEADQARITADMDRATAALQAAQTGAAPWQVPLPATATAGATVGPEPAGTIAPVAFRGGAIREARGLLGANAAALVRALGPPDLRRREGDGEAWLYRGQTCMLDVVLYPDGPQGREPRVAFAAARAVGFERVPEHACLAEITRANQLVARARE